MRHARVAAVAVMLGGLGMIAWAAGSNVQHATADPSVQLSPDLDQGNTAAPEPGAVPARHAPPAPPPITADTPMAERVAVLGVLNKRNGIARDISLHPGQAMRIGDLIVRLRACDTTADWEPEQLTGAFVQADVHGVDGQWRRVFSGWLYKESPSLNVVQDARYDVWPKSCAMRHPEIGPDTVTPSASVPRSIARKSAEAPTPPADAAPSPSASSNSVM